MSKSKGTIGETALLRELRRAMTLRDIATILRRVLAVCGLRIADEYRDLIDARDLRVWASLHTPYRLGCRREPAHPLREDPRQDQEPE